MADLFDLGAIDDALSGKHVNYQLNMIKLTDLDENNFKTGLRELIGMMKRRDNKEEMGRYCRENKERFSRLDDNTYDIICTMLNLKTLEVAKEKYRKESEENDMCKAFEDLKKDWKAEGKREGKREGEIIGERKGERKGEEMLSRLIGRLLEDNRIEDVKKVTQNITFRKKMYREYGIQ